MTDNDIIKGLKACGYNETCADCPYIDIERGDCTEEMAKNAFNLINRQKEEIKRLKDIAESPILSKLIYVWKNEAIKEFAKKLKESAFDVDVSFGYGKICYDKAVAVIEIDNLVKEMVGEDDTIHPDERKEKSNEHNKPN